MPALQSASQNAKPLEQPQRIRPTFGFIVSWGFTNPYSSSMWWGAVEAAEALDINLVGFGDIDIFDLQRNRSMYLQIRSDALDGLVLVNPTFPRLHREVFGSIPVVNIGSLAEDVVTSIMVDNYGGMRSVINHMIEGHGCRKLAIIKGPPNNPDSDARFRAYADVLTAHGLPVDPSLIYQPIDWSPPVGQEAVRALLDERGMQFEALIASNDNMALAALEELKQRGRCVPYDVLVSGFDDVIETRTATPPLTTVRQPFQQMGRLAVEMLLAHHQGKSVPKEVVLPTTLIVRQSCGCFSESAIRTENSSPYPAEGQAFQNGSDLPVRQLLSARRETILEEVRRAASQRDAIERSHVAEAWLEAFQISLESDGSGVLLLKAIDLTSRAYLERQQPIAELQELLWILRREGSRALTGHSKELILAENLCHRARIFLDELALQQQMQERIRVLQKISALRSIHQAMAVTFQLDPLMDILVRDLKQLGIKGCYVALYSGENRPAERIRWILAWEEDRRLSSEALKTERRYPTAPLLPAELGTERRHSLMLSALEFQREEIGFVLFDIGPHDGEIYESLRSQLASSIKGTLLGLERENLLGRTAQLDLDIIEKQQLVDEANQTKSRFLSIVGHELRTPLSLISGLSELIIWDANNQKPVNRENLEQVHLTTQHLDGMIRDILDLERDAIGELRLACEPLDMAKVLDSVASVGEQLTRTKGLDWQVQIPANLPLVWGDLTRLQQIGFTLIHNAIRFTRNGQVRLQAAYSKDLITVSVSDTGLGIPPEKQSALFDEFRPFDGAAPRRDGGYGLELAMSKRLVKMHGGEIGVRSSGVDGEGATFYFSLPILRATAVLGKSASTVWIISSQPEDAQPLNRHLEEQGFNTEVLFWDENGQWEARSGQTPPAAVVMDSEKTPELVWDAMRALKVYPVTLDSMVLFYKLKAEPIGGAALGLDYLATPTGPPELIRALRRVGTVEESEETEGAVESPKTLLIVDGDPSVLDMYAQIIRVKFPHYRVLLSTSGMEALLQIQTERPDLVFLDLLMPDLDSFRVLESMQKRETAHPIPIMVLNAQILTEAEMTRLNRSILTVLNSMDSSSVELAEHIQGSPTSPQKINGEVQRLTRKAMAYIHEHYAEPITRKDIARYVGVSEGYLSRSFNQEIGSSLKHYLGRYRIQRAKKLLAASEKTITEIALEVGFSNSNYFSRIFRQEVGVSPLAYRRSY